MENRDQKIGEIIRGWITSAECKQGKIAEYLGIKQATISMMLSGKAAFPKDKISMLIDKFNPPSKDVSKVFELFFWGSEKRPSRVIEAGWEESKVLAALEEFNQIEPLDGLFIEFARHWSKFDVEQKLTALVYINQISRGELGFGTRKH
jgi:transcriptional regulator with XRE-family HTH domain